MRHINTQTNARRFKNQIILASSTALLMAVSSPTVIAQQVNDALNKSGQEENLEVIEVSGVRSSLENALNVKREAPSIVDAISATDIDALPALDFGEALQALPGVQLDRSNEGRTSEISLRGLSGGFVKTTAFGQSFATPSRSAGPTGGTNPFAAFEAGVFDGVTLVKSPTADMQAGGMAGIVDKQLQQALSKKDGKYNVSLGGRYEELTGNWDKSIKFSASKHLIKDELAVAFKFAGSDQTFRRDLIQFSQYSSFEETTNDGRVVSESIAAYKEKYGLAADANVLGVASGRNVSEYSEGDRNSFTGNIEWRATDDLKLGAHLLYTKRDLGEGTKEDTAFTAGLNPTRSDRHQRHAGFEPDMETAPFIYKHDEDGNPIYVVSQSNFTDGSWLVTNRKTTFLETSKGLMLYGDYVKDDWVFDSVVSYSEAENEFMNIGLDFRHIEHHNASVNHLAAGADSRVTINSVGTGIDGTLNTGQGAMSQMAVAATGWENFNYDNLNWSAPSTSGASVTSMDPSNGGVRIGHYIDGRVDNPTRTMKAAEFNAERYTEFEFGDVINVNSIKFGVRHSIEDLQNRDQKIGAPGVNVANINAMFFSDNLLTEQQTSFFDGKLPGTFDVSNGWLTLDTPYVTSQLQDGMADLTQVTEDNPVALAFADPSGFYDRLNSGTQLPQFYTNNFATEQGITAAYVMASFEGEIGDIMYSGNAGLRYERTANDFDGRSVTQVDGVSVPSEFTFSTDYSNTLPTINLAFNLHEDFVFRASYYQSLVRPNLRNQNPALSVSENNSSINITLPKAEVKPYTADNYDLSFEWYNREGSAISIGLFRKNITGLFDTSKDCPSLGEYPFLDEVYGEFVGEDSELPGNCIQSTAFINPDTGEEINRTVTVNRTFNADNEIKLTGAEFAVQQKLDFLPYPWNGFGGVFNYTYIDQDATLEGDSKLYKVSPSSYNLIGYWENDGISIRLAYNWRDKFDIQYPGGSYYGTEDRTVKASGRLDLASSYKVNKDLRLHFKAYNLTNEQTYEYFGDDEKAIARLDYTGRIYEVSLNYAF
ncbi:TonB-dependent receptor [Aliiglaciecola sp. 3_MG-2023]|uniref:TonB-dependent receptor n=1 Tax=Aliiglaciecola sp. 3_MG-2023 TaxID=3062644 RepID=UPI0026E3708B|nr:TonB-dependent receptor [Aliiglaciecola sp. 3_MG-2023]MDO6693288.1 TonB-dependent receptor [Aliiglaciecola sp. 3_MG-2023]